MKIQKLLLMTLMTMVTCMPKISAMCRLSIRPVAAQMVLGATVRGLHSIPSFNASDSQDAGAKAKKYSFSDMFKAMRNNKKKVMAGLLVVDIMYEWQELSKIAKIDTRNEISKSIQNGIEKQHGKLVPCEKQELLDVFEELKTRMGVSQKYKLYISSKTCSEGEAAFCVREYSIVYLCSGFFDLSPSEQIRALSHELQHSRQVDLLVAQSFICNDGYYRDESNKNNEQDSEATAVKMITCAQCLKGFAMSIEEQTALLLKLKFNMNASECAQRIQANRALLADHLVNMQSQGYMIPSDYEPYLEKALKNDKPCKAHVQGGTSHDVRDYLPQIESK